MRALDDPSAHGPWTRPKSWNPRLGRRAGALFCAPALFHPNEGWLKRLLFGAGCQREDWPGDGGQLAARRRDLQPS